MLANTVGYFLLRSYIIRQSIKAYITDKERHRDALQTMLFKSSKKDPTDVPVSLLLRYLMGSKCLFIFISKIRKTCFPPKLPRQIWLLKL